MLLAGIVFFNVDLLQMNRDIARDAERAAALKRENARLRLEVARLASSERIQEAASGLGLVLPAPGQVRYLKAHPGRDAHRAAKRITEPDGTLTPPAPASASDSAVPPAAATAPADPAATTSPTTTPPVTTPAPTAPPGTTPPAGTTTTPPAGTTTTPPAATVPPAGTSPTVPEATAPPGASGGPAPTTTGQTAPATTGPAG